MSLNVSRSKLRTNLPSSSAFKLITSDPAREDYLLKKHYKDQVQSIVVQYILKYEDFAAQTRDKHCGHIIKSLLTMEKESCFFLLKRAQVPTGRGGRNGSAHSKEVEPGRDACQQSNASFDQSSQHEPALQAGAPFEAMSHKSFFFLLQDYLSQADEYLKGTVCTFHNILKNCLLQSINSEVIKHSSSSQRSGDSYEVTHQICYFKNFNFQNKRQMKINRVERCIKERMQMLGKDRTQFLRSQYPELLRDLATRVDLMDDIKPSQQFRHLKFADQTCPLPPENNIFEFDSLLQNAFHIATQNMEVPYLEKRAGADVQKPGDQNFAKNAEAFYRRTRAIFEDFSDFKKQSDELDSFDLYFKLIAKEVIFMIRIPSLNQIQKQLAGGLSLATNIEVDYFFVKKKMIGISRQLKESRVWKFFTSDSDFIYTATRRKSVAGPVQARLLRDSRSRLQQRKVESDLYSEHGFSNSAGSNNGTKSPGFRNCP